jgi:23S rRNA pseudouridine955/2504/2580 synthase
MRKPDETARARPATAIGRCFADARVNSGKSSTYRTNVERQIIGVKVAASNGPKRRGLSSPPAVTVAATPVVPAVQHLVVDEESAGQRLDNFLLRFLKGVPKTHVYRVIRSGEVRVNKGRAAADTRVQAGDDIRVPPVRLAERPAGPAAPAREFPVLFEDEHLLAIDKPAGVAVHGGSGVSSGVIEQLRQARPRRASWNWCTGWTGNLRRAAAGQEAQRADRRAGPVPRARHRQDLPGPGLRCLAREAEGHRRALAQDAGRRGERHVRVVSPAHEDGRRSITLVRSVRAVFRRLHAAGRDLKTGRTHQIRVHLAHAGHPIVGDPKYGDFALNRELARGPQRFTRMFLHAHELTFDHPASGQRIDPAIAPATRVRDTPRP